jgi:hypothetical protein
MRLVDRPTDRPRDDVLYTHTYNQTHTQIESQIYTYIHTYIHTYIPGTKTSHSGDSHLRDPNPNANPNRNSEHVQPMCCEGGVALIAFATEDQWQQHYRVVHSRHMPRFDRARVRNVTCDESP